MPPETAADPSDFSHYADIFATWPAEITAAAMTLSGRPQEKWSWIYTNITDDGTEEFRWDPARPPRERSALLAKNDTPATAKEQAEHIEKRQKDEARRAKTPPAQRIARARAWLETLEFQLLEETELTSTWKVTSRAADHDSLPIADRIRNRVLAALQSRIVVSESPPGFIEIAMKNEGPIRAYFSVNISEVDILLRNALQPDTNTFLPVEVSGKLRGRYLLFGQIDTTWRTTFRDYAPVRPPDRSAR